MSVVPKGKAPDAQAADVLAQIKAGTAGAGTYQDEEAQQYRYGAKSALLGAHHGDGERAAA